MSERVKMGPEQKKKILNALRTKGNKFEIIIDSLGSRKLPTDKQTLVYSDHYPFGSVDKLVTLFGPPEWQLEKVKDLMQNKSQIINRPEKDGDGVEVIYRPRSVNGKQEVKSSEIGDEKEKIKGKKIKRGRKSEPRER